MPEPSSMKEVPKKVEIVVPIVQPAVLPIENGVKWRKWQQTLFDQVKEPNVRNDGRSIIWYYDNVTSTGKTFFSDHFPGMCKKQVIVTDTIKEMENNLDVYKKIKIHPQVYIFNIGNLASSEITDNFYINLERYSDIFRNSFFIVFSNTFPMLDGMSMNRWIIRRSPRFKDIEEKDCVEVDRRKIVNKATMVKRVFKTILSNENKMDYNDYSKLLHRKDKIDFYLREEAKERVIKASFNFCIINSLHITYGKDFDILLVVWLVFRFLF